MKLKMDFWIVLIIDLKIFIMKKITIFTALVFFFLLYSCIPSLHSIVNDKNRIVDDRIVGDWIFSDDIFANPILNYSVKADNEEEQKEGEKLMQEYIDELKAKRNYSTWKFERAAKLKFKYEKNPEGTTSWSAEMIGGVESSLAAIRAQYENEDIVIEQQELLPYYFLTYETSDFPDASEYMKIELTKIGGEIYMDIFPRKVNNGSGRFTSNFIGAHTFAKLTFEKGKLLIHSFNVEKIEHLLKSKRVRLKHEIVTTATQESNKIIYEDNIILTAPTEELRAFIEKYGKTEDLFEDPEELTAYNDEKNTK